MSRLVDKIYFFIKYFIPVFLVAGIIFYLSDKPGLGSWMPNPIEVILRKGAHFTEYGLLTFFVWRLFYFGWQYLLKNSFWFTLLLVTLFSASDEFHQTFVAGRHGSIIDIIVDFVSIFIILQLILFVIKRKIKNLLLFFLGITIFIGIVGWMTWQTFQKEAVKVGNEIIKSIDVKDDSKDKLLNQGGFNQVGNISINLKDKIGKPANNNKTKEDNLSIKEDKNNSLKTKNEIQEENIVFPKAPLPKTIKNKIPFMTQSPFAKWDQLHEEACEEASLIMLKYYNDILGEENKRQEIERQNFLISKKKAEDEIQDLVKYQMDKYGDFYDTDVMTTKKIGEDYFGLNNLKMIENFKIMDLKKELAQGNIILIPTAGRELKNPNFTPPGPLYHNLIIVGYDDSIDPKTNRAKSIFITNDPGTRRGQNYEYKQEVLYNAIHDFPGDVNRILEGRKRAIILVK